MKSFNLSTKSRDSMTDVTSQVQKAVGESGVQNGLCLVYCPHTTAGLTINENADPAVPRDIITVLDRMVPWTGGYAHAEGNTAAHVKSSMMGCSAKIIVEDGRLVLGTWQSVFFCDFDGPRSRRFMVQVIPA
jgi:secondary thiamine-phosphate synthase enzyme